MRAMFTYAGGSGHREPLVPIAEALRAARHDVSFQEEPGDRPDTGGAIEPLRPLDMAHEYGVLRDFYAGREARARVAQVLERIDGWDPDVVVCDEVDFGAMIAAERRGRPHVTVSVIAAGSFVRPDIVAAPLDALRERHGLPPDPGLSMPSRHLVVSPFPPRFRDPAFPLPRTAISIRPGSVAEGSTAHGLRSTSDRPLVYVTLGTVFNTESGDLFERLLAGLGHLPVEAIVTVGHDLDPSRFGPQPAHVRVEPYVPQSEVLPHCTATINHGGSGSVVGALAHGVPMVVIPMGADQASNAGRCQALGVGLVLDAVDATGESIGDAVTTLLDVPGFRAAAERLRDEIAGLPGPESVVPLIERLA
jgi:UDP:flavonoid glycosyltransferase YjiC (YdhE family)